ncbi:hypothetical protein GIB67_038539 [Kingdonia uniflora]|uniref:RING-type domain-containing protein n=1 Tax=Kingdonia uniflora TaxID=39325 RepID=A0A7J7NPZ8_9MAGN|nr:hypothetical protein GIB67_038539 [Kingdonia uniflora]
MGFPVGYAELFLPKLLLHTLFVLGFIGKLISSLFQSLGLRDFLESETTWSEGQTPLSDFHYVSTLLIRELLQVVKFKDLLSSNGGETETPESCAVCLYEFEGEDEIRLLTNCCHIYLKCCLDRWMDHDQKTCPLCITPFIPDELQKAFNERLWAASGNSEFYCGAGGGKASSLVELEPVRASEEYALECNYECKLDFNRTKEVSEDSADQYVKLDIKLSKGELVSVHNEVAKLNSKVELLGAKGKDADIAQYRIRILEIEAKELKDNLVSLMGQLDKKKIKLLNARANFASAESELRAYLVSSHGKKAEVGERSKKRKSGVVVVTAKGDVEKTQARSKELEADLAVVRAAIRKANERARESCDRLEGIWGVKKNRADQEKSMGLFSELTDAMSDLERRLERAKPITHI